MLRTVTAADCDSNSPPPPAILAVLMCSCPAFCAFWAAGMPATLPPITAQSTCRLSPACSLRQLQLRSVRCSPAQEAAWFSNPSSPPANFLFLFRKCPVPTDTDLDHCASSLRIAPSFSAHARHAGAAFLLGAAARTRRERRRLPPCLCTASCWSPTVRSHRLGCVNPCPGPARPWHAQSLRQMQEHCSGWEASCCHPQCKRPGHLHGGWLAQQQAGRCRSLGRNTTGPAGPAPRLSNRAGGRR